MGSDSYDMVGFHLAFGDVNGDGLEDALIASPRAGGGGDKGATYLVLGPATGLQDLVSESEARWDGTSTDQKVQAGVESGDVDRDGRDDVLLGAPQDRTAGRGAGGVFLFYGPVEGVHPVADAEAWILGREESAELGQGVAVGDLGGGPGADLALGAVGGTGTVFSLLDPEGP